LTSSKTAGNLEALSGMPVLEVAIADAHHHLILDQPELVGAALADLLGRLE
jgi:hypothetical protein